jgi:hypothetical protein
MTKYKNEDRIAQEEAELERLEADYRKQYGEKSTEEGNSPPEPVSDAQLQEEETWKKRHSDLRSYTQRQLNDKDKEILALREEISKAEKANRQRDLPKNKEELENWVSEYPDLARVLGTMIDTRAEAQITNVADEVRSVKMELEAERTAMAKERALNEVLKAHPDFLSLIQTQDFKDWVEKQPLPKSEGGRGKIGQAIYEALWVNETDPEAAIQAVDVYKQDKAGSRRPSPDREAALTVKKTSSGTPASDGGKKTWKESEIENLQYWEWDKYEKEIEDARREGRIIYDLSGAAR